MSSRPPENPPSPGSFPQTRWTRVVDLHSEDPEQARRALAELCETYWQPLYVFFRRSGRGPEDARDCTQGLFEQMISRDDFLTADSDRGRLRNFLLTLAKRHLISTIRRDNAEKRGGSSLPLSMDCEEFEIQYAAQTADQRSPETLFDRQWANVTIATARANLAREYDSRGRSVQFEVLSRYLSWNESGEDGYREAAAEAGLTEEALRAAISRMRKRFRTLLRDQVADTLGDPSMVEQEIQSLFWALRS